MTPEELAAIIAPQINEISKMIEDLNKKIQDKKEPEIKEPTVSDAVSQWITSKQNGGLGGKSLEQMPNIPQSPNNALGGKAV